MTIGAHSPESSSTIRAHLRAFPELMRVSFARLVAYRAEMTIWILTASMPLVMLALWNAVASDGPVAGFDQFELARYFACTLIVRQLTGAWIVWELNWQIRSGALSPKLLRPVHPLWQEALWMLSAVPFRLVVLLPLLTGLFLWRPELWQAPSAAGFALFLVSITLAWGMAFLIQAIFGMLSFWFDQSMGMFGVWFTTWTVLSGYTAPLGVFPEAVQSLNTFLPFRGMLGVPVELLSGVLRPEDAGLDLAVQAGWVVGCGVLAVHLWRAGVKRYGAYGA
jgi:ABC-2 type transport system permease protein